MGLVVHCVSLGPSLSPASVLSFRKGSGWAGKSEDLAWTVRAEGQETEGLERWEGSQASVGHWGVPRRRTWSGAAAGRCLIRN